MVRKWDLDQPFGPLYLSTNNSHVYLQEIVSKLIFEQTNLTQKEVTRFIDEEMICKDEPE